MKSLRAIENEIIGCRDCPRLVRHREAIAAAKTKRFADEAYWGRAVPSFGDPRARLLVVGLAPAAHGANRTGRMFTGDRSGEWLYAALHRHGFATAPTSVSRFDELRLEDAFITAVARCAPPANKPLREEMEKCRRYLAGELRVLELRVVVALGRIAFDGFLAAWEDLGHVLRPKPRFAHGSEHAIGSGVHLLGSYHPSQQNTFTGRLTRPMFHRVFRRARRLLDES